MAKLDELGKQIRNHSQWQREPTISSMVYTALPGGAYQKGAPLVAYSTTGTQANYTAASTIPADFR